MSGPTIQGIQTLIDKDPGAYWDTDCKCVKNSAFADQPARVPDSALRPRSTTPTGKAERPRRRLQDRQLPRLLRRAAAGELDLQDASRRLSALVDDDAGPAPVNCVPQSDPAGAVTMAQLVGAHRLGRRRVQEALRPSAARRRDSGQRRSTSAPAATSTPPDLVIVDTRGDASSAMSTIERLRARRPAPASSPIALGGRSRSDPAVDARRRQRVLHLAAGRGNVPRRGAPHGGAARNGAGRAAVGDDAGVLRRQGRRRHDDGRRSTAASSWRG